MKRLPVLALIFCLVLGLCACGKAAPTSSSFPLNDVMQKIRSEVDLPEMLDLTGENLPDYLGIDLQMLSDFAVCVNANGYEKEEIVLLRAANASDIPAITEALNTSLQNAASEMQNYLPQQYTLIKNSTVRTDGLYVTLFISANSEQILEIWNSYLRNH